jgi:hypothetical protein
VCLIWKYLLKLRRRKKKDVTLSGLGPLAPSFFMMVIPCVKHDLATRMRMITRRTKLLEALGTSYDVRVLQ